MIKGKTLLILMATLVIGGWLVFMVTTQKLVLFETNWFMTLTMILGSFIAGATSEGGGAVAFPVMTFLFNMEPTTARDFSLMIQSFGMTMAALTIWALKIKLIPMAVIYGSLGGALGIIVGLAFGQGILNPTYTKMFFTSFWLSFALALIFISKKEDELTRESLTELSATKHLSLMAIGFLGGIFSSLVGTGIDILIFSYLTLRLKVCVKVATPTSVVLMGINSLVGFGFKHFFVPGGMALEAWDYLYVCIPVVVLGAPLGAIFISQKSKSFIEKLLLLSIVLQFLGSLLIIDQTPKLLLFSLGIFLGGVFLFVSLGTHQKVMFFQSK